MKKLFGVKALVVMLFTGIFMMGIGCGVSFFEFQGMTYAGEKVIDSDSFISREETISLPENEMKIFYPGYSISIEEDNTVEKGRGLLEYSAPLSYNPQVVFSDSAYIYSVATGHVSPHKYNFLTVYTTDDYGDMEMFKTFMYDIKERKLYTYVKPEITLTLKVNPLDYPKFEVMGDDYSSLGEIPPQIKKYGDEIYYNSNTDEYYTYNEHGDYEVIYPIYEQKYDDYTENYYESDY